MPMEPVSRMKINRDNLFRREAKTPIIAGITMIEMIQDEDEVPTS
jgi:hypothetical protein